MDIWPTTHARAATTGCAKELVLTILASTDLAAPSSMSLTQSGARHGNLRLATSLPKRTAEPWERTKLEQSLRSFCKTSKSPWENTPSAKANWTPQLKRRRQPLAGVWMWASARLIWEVRYWPSLFGALFSNKRTSIKSSFATLS